jgi:hypothetical protein
LSAAQFSCSFCGAGRGTHGCHYRPRLLQPPWVCAPRAPKHQRGKDRAGGGCGRGQRSSELNFPLCAGCNQVHAQHRGCSRRSGAAAPRSQHTGWLTREATWAGLGWRILCEGRREEGVVASGGGGGKELGARDAPAKPIPHSALAGTGCPALGGGRLCTSTVHACVLIAYRERAVETPTSPGPPRQPCPPHLLRVTDVSFAVPSAPPPSGPAVHPIGAFQGHHCGARLAGGLPGQHHSLGGHVWRARCAPHRTSLPAVTPWLLSSARANAMPARQLLPRSAAAAAVLLMGWDVRVVGSTRASPQVRGTQVVAACVHRCPRLPLPPPQLRAPAAYGDEVVAQVVYVTDSLGCLPFVLPQTASPKGARNLGTPVAFSCRSAHVAPTNPRPRLRACACVAWLCARVLAGSGGTY